MLNERKCAIIGCGFVGATTAYTLMQSGMFSEMVLIDIDKKKAEGEAADLGHGLPFHAPMDIYAGDYSDLSDCFLIIITARVLMLSVSGIFAILFLTASRYFLSSSICFLGFLPADTKPL